MEWKIKTQLRWSIFITKLLQQRPRKLRRKKAFCFLRGLYLILVLSPEYLEPSARQQWLNYSFYIKGICVLMWIEYIHYLVILDNFHINYLSSGFLKWLKNLIRGRLRCKFWFSMRFYLRWISRFEK